MDIDSKDYQRAKDFTLWRIRTYSQKVESGCIEWQRTKSKQGYGVIAVTLDGKKTINEYTHRILWELTHDVELGKNICVCHRCDNPACVNIKHLFAGTRKENSQDMARKGRAHKPQKVAGKLPVKYKPHTRLRKYPNDVIRAIREASGSLREVSELFNVSESYVSKLRNGKAKALIGV